MIMKKHKMHKKETEEKLALPKRNVWMLAAALAVRVVGFVLMAGGGSQDPEIFTGQALFNFRRMVVAPILVCGGFVYGVVAIMRIKKKKDDERA